MDTSTAGLIGVQIQEERIISGGSAGERFIARVAAIAILTLLSVHAWAGAPKAIAVMDCQILDDTREHNAPEVDVAQDKRLKSITEELKLEFSQRELYAVLDSSTVSDRMEAVKSRGTFYGCNGCEMEIAKAMNADRVAICWVQKVSNLILNINIQVKDVRTGAMVYGKSVDLRGNTDTSWLRRHTLHGGQHCREEAVFEITGNGRLRSQHSSSHTKQMSGVLAFYHAAAHYHGWRRADGVNQHSPGDFMARSNNLKCHKPLLLAPFDV